MSVIDLQIALTDNKFVYYTGEKITGNLIIKITDKLNINRIRLSAIGYGKVFW